MKDHEWKVNMKKSKTRQNQSSKWKFHKVLDTRGKPVPNLWQRNNRFYAQLTLKEDGKTKNTKLPLKAASLSEAKAEIEDLKSKRRKNQLARAIKVPRLHAYCHDYMSHQEQIKRKKPSSLKSERGHIGHWKRLLGDIRLTEINPALIRRAMGGMREQGLATPFSAKTFSDVKSHCDGGNGFCLSCARAGRQRHKANKAMRVGFMLLFSPIHIGGVRAVCVFHIFGFANLHSTFWDILTGFQIGERFAFTKANRSSLFGIEE